MMPGRIRHYLSCALFLAIASCSSDSSPTPPAKQISQSIAIPNVFTGASSSVQGAAAVAAVEIRRIRLTVYESPGNAILFQKTYDVDPSLSSWTL